MIDRSIGKIGMVEGGSWSKCVAKALSGLNITEAGSIVQKV
jgi:hypothetical protein